MHSTIATSLADESWEGLPTRGGVCGWLGRWFPRRGWRTALRGEGGMGGCEAPSRYCHPSMCFKDPAIGCVFFLTLVRLMHSTNLTAPRVCLPSPNGPPFPSEGEA